MSKKILIIDDEPELVRAIEIRLKAAGYKTECAYDGLTGIDKAKETKPDIIILDIIMPGMTGYDVCKSIKADEKTKDIPILVLSASQQLNLEAKCKELGIRHFVLKPFEAKELLGLVNELIGEK